MIQFTNKMQVRIWFGPLVHWKFNENWKLAIENWKI